MIRLPDRPRRCVDMIRVAHHPDRGHWRECGVRLGWWRSWSTDRCRRHQSWAPAWLAWPAGWLAVAHCYAAWAITRAGYWIRPYDPSADARRWRWQPPACWHHRKGTR